jgi:hypothetical protein
METKLVEFKHFVMFELPRLKYLDWQLIAKEDRQRASRMNADGLWSDKQVQTPVAVTSVHVRTPSVEVNKNSQPNSRIDNGM